MKVTLKSVKHLPHASDETNCFQASIYIDGKRAGKAYNTGQGGPTIYGFLDPQVGEDFDAYAKSLPPVEFEGFDGKPMSIPMNGELLIDELLSEYLKKEHQKKIEKTAKKHKESNAKRGYLTLQIQDSTKTLFTGIRSEKDIPKAVELAVQKHGFNNPTYSLV